MKDATLIDLLLERGQMNNIGITFIESSEQELFFSYSQLYQESLKALAILQNKGIRPADELIIQIQDNKAFITVFWACILGGIIPVPLTVGQNDSHREKVYKVWSVLNNPYLITDTNNFSRLGAFARNNGFDKIYAAINDKNINEPDIALSTEDGMLYDAKPNDIAFIQFSSGSTGDPRGVVLTHKNLLINLAAIEQGARYTPLDSTLSWMPLTHDMGLIGFHLNPLFSSLNQFLIPTAQFIRRPALWLDKVSEHAVNVICSPNFGCKYLLTHCQPDANRNWNLQHVRILFNGAEPISEIICHEFITWLSPYGLSRNAMCPVYGLAEGTLAVTISELHNELISIKVNRKQLNTGDQILITEDDTNAVSFVNVGRPVNNCLLKIVDDNDQPVLADTIGHIQLQGESITSGYYNNEAASARIITADGWLRTGDLGFIHEDCLYVTGRAKDVFFVNGQNYYPHDIEQAAQEVEGISLNKIVVAGAPDPFRQTEMPVAFVFYRGKLSDFIPLRNALKEHVNHKTGIELNRIIPVNDIPRTTSGKLQRYKLVEQLLRGDFIDVEKEVRILIEEAQKTAFIQDLPSSDNEQKLLAIWQRVLNNTNISVTQRFFDIGGNSLKAAEVAMLLAKEYQAELPVEILYDKQTIREIAPEIQYSEKTIYKPITVSPVNEYYPVSWAQKRLYYFWQLNKTSLAYNVPVALCIKGNINIIRLEKNINALIQRHDALRMSFYMKGEPVFRVHVTEPFHLMVIECGDDRLDTELKNLVQPFNLETAPLFRGVLLTIQPKECILFLDFHHIIADGMTVYNFIQELFDLYSGHELKPLPIAYKDYVHWERQNDQVEIINLQKAYWLNTLEGELPLLKMPADYPRPAIFNTEGAKLSFQLSKESSAQLRRMAAAYNCTLHVLLFSIYNVLLSKITGQEDIIIGLPVSGRRHPDLQTIAGMFVNNLAVRTTVNAEDTFVQFLAKQKSKVLAALNNQEYPLDQLVQHIGSAPDSSRNPLFDTMFIYQNMGMPHMENADINVAPHYFDAGACKFDISLEVFEQPDAIPYYIEYSTNLFKKETIVRLSAYFEQLIQCAVNNDRARIADWSLMNEHEYVQHVIAFNQTERNYPKNSVIHQLFRQQVQRTPENIAIEYKGTSISYQELYNKASSLAMLLRQQGVMPDGIVAILLQRSPELIISILAVLMAGGCYLPIEPALPDERIHLLIQQSRCRLIITEGAYVGRLPSTTAIINLNTIELPVSDTGIMTNMSDPDNLAYIIYTSGTTGHPKGVMITHRSLVNYVCWAAYNYVKEATVTFPLYTSVAFDLTVTSIFTPLITGNRIVVYNEEERDLLIRHVVMDNKCDIIKLTPSHLKILASDKLLAGSGSRIKRLIVGGEQLDTSLAKKIVDQCSGQIEILNEYGPTEATVGCMIHAFTSKEQTENVPVGVPAANMRVYILDNYLQPVAPGVHGEMYLAGDGIAKGYLFNHELTKQKFITDPFREGQIMYSTGDIARWLPEGIIEYLGRRDEQVKINGYRVELSEIVQCLLEHPLVVAAVAALKAREGKPILCAYIQLKRAQRTFETEVILRNYVAGKLPYYMIPACFIVIDEMPLTTNGKIDYNALPEPTLVTHKEIKQPHSKLERIMLQVWEEVLEESGLNVTDNFFALGGDSIKAVQIASRLSGKGIIVTARDILTWHTIEQLCLHTDLSTADNPYDDGALEGSKGLIPIERWFFEQSFSNPHYYNQSVLLKFHKKVDKDLLEKAFQELIRHHDGLRLNYRPHTGELFYNPVYLNGPFMIDSYAIPEGDDGELLAEICQEIKSTFDIINSLLLKAALITYANGKQMLFVTAHHLVTDGLSWRIMLEDLYTLYASQENGNSKALSHKTASLATWQQKWLYYAQTQQSEQINKYWQEIDNTAFFIPLDYNTDDWETRNRKKISNSLSREITDTLLKETWHIYKSDIRVLLSTALALALRKWTKRTVVVIEYENHGRHPELIDTSRTIGWFTEMYPVRFELANEETDGGMKTIKAIKEQVNKAADRGMEYGIYKYGQVQYGQPIQKRTEIRFNYLGQFSSEVSNDLFSYSHQSTGSDIDPRNKMTAKLELVAMIVHGQLCLDIYYNSKAHTDQTITTFMDNLLGELTETVSYIKEKNNITLTSSDFDAANLDDEELNVLFN